MLLVLLAVVPAALFVAMRRAADTPRHAVRLLLRAMEHGDMAAVDRLTTPRGRDSLRAMISDDRMEPVKGGRAWAIANTPEEFARREPTYRAKSRVTQPAESSPEVYALFARWAACQKSRLECSDPAVAPAPLCGLCRGHLRYVGTRGGTYFSLHLEDNSAGQTLLFKRTDKGWKFDTETVANSIQWKSPWFPDSEKDMAAFFHSRSP